MAESGIWLTTGYRPYHFYIVEAKNPFSFRLDYTSILYIHKVFKHLWMQWILVIWVHPYCIKA